VTHSIGLTGGRRKPKHNLSIASNDNENAYGYVTKINGANYNPNSVLLVVTNSAMEIEENYTESLSCKICSLNEEFKNFYSILSHHVIPLYDYKIFFLL